MRYIISIICLLTIITLDSRASLLSERGMHGVVSNNEEKAKELTDVLKPYFEKYKRSGYRPMRKYGIDSLKVDDEHKEVLLYPNEPFYSQLIDEGLLKNIYKNISRLLPKDYSDYKLRLLAKRDTPFESLIPNYLRTDSIDTKRMWGEKDASKNAPWVKSITRPYTITKGLQNRHLMVYPSHGYYYKNKISQWGWQRPYLFSTTEDLLTQSIVYPYLFPMLERAGGIVVTNRERDSQTSMLIIDNDQPATNGTYVEKLVSTQQWKTIEESRGFSFTEGTLHDGLNPFQSGTAKYIETVKGKREASTVCWTPSFTKSGRYAVYVSYVSLPNSVTNAKYIVYHAGGESVFSVNQQIGGNTWVYLGTFEFLADAENLQGVVLTNQSNEAGIVSADAVRFGGGMGLSAREGKVSHLPAYLEAARYYTQWAGLPEELYNTEGSENDYLDDLRCRSYFTNYLAGGSVYLPQHSGLSIPIEFSTALHTDAGHRKDNSVYGTLSISTNYHKSTGDTLVSGISRMASFDLAHMMVENVARDLSYHFNTQWTRRDTWDRNYSETRSPHIPSLILEMLSHQNFTDMRFAHDPYAKFHIARSIYKSLLKYVNYQHGITDVVVQPLPIRHFSALLDSENNRVTLRWQPTDDPLEPSATPTQYIVYTKMGDLGFDKGQVVNQSHFTMPISPGVHYAFRVSALNEGGESFPSEEMTVFKAPNEQARVLIVNGFTRLSGPAIVQNADSIGFDLHKNIGIPYVSTSAIAGAQVCFDPNMAGKEGEGALGFSTNEWIGKSIAGNTFDFTTQHGRALAMSQEFSFASTSVTALEEGAINLADYDVIDYILGRQSTAPENLRPAKTFSPLIQSRLTSFASNGGKILVSGAHIGSDMRMPAEQNFLSNVLGVTYGGYVPSDSCETIVGLNLRLPIYNQPSDQHYSTGYPDILLPANDNAFSAFAYKMGVSAGVAYQPSTHRAITMGVPFECISDANLRASVMRAIIFYLIEK